VRPDNYEKAIGFEAHCALKTVRTALPPISIIRISLINFSSPKGYSGEERN